MRHISIILSTVIVLGAGLLAAGEGVSPGAADHISRIGTRCPTFSWQESDTASAYELVIYRLEDEGQAEIRLDAESEVLFTRLPSRVSSWTPAEDQCFEAGKRYVWFVRDLASRDGEEIPGEWSEGRYFEIGAAPSSEELARAIEVLRRWDDARETGVASGTEGRRAVELSRSANVRSQGSPSPAKDVRASSTTISGANTSTSGAAFGVLGRTASSDGAGIVAVNDAGGADLILDGTADHVPPTNLSQSGLDRPSDSNETFLFENSGAGGITLDIAGNLEADGLSCPSCVRSASLADGAVTRSKLSATGGTSGQVLATDGSGLVWQDAGSGSGDITAVLAGANLTGGGTSGDVTLGLRVPIVEDENYGAYIVTLTNHGSSTFHSKTTAEGAHAIKGEASAADGIGVWGEVTSTSETIEGGAGVSGLTHKYQSSGVRGLCDALVACSGTSGELNNIMWNPYPLTFQKSVAGVTGISNNANGVYGESVNWAGIQGQGAPGIWGRGTNGQPGGGSPGSNIGVLGEGTVGVKGQGDFVGVNGATSGNGGAGVKGIAETDVTHQTFGVWGEATDENDLGVYAKNQNGTALAVEGSGTGPDYPAAMVLAHTNGARGLVVDAHGSSSIIVSFRNDNATRLYMKTNGSTHVAGTGSGNDNSTLYVDNSSSTGIAIHATSDSTEPTAIFANSGTGELIRAFHGSTIRFRVDTDGEVYADGSFHSGGADFAELVPVREDDLAPGDVVALDVDGHLIKTTMAYQASVVGVVSTRPGYQSDFFEKVPAARKVPLAMVGIVPVKATAAGGSIRPGDMLTSSDIPGIAMRARHPWTGTVLGKAMQPLESGEGTVLLLVSPR